jgi:hypothetical protein
VAGQVIFESGYVLNVWKLLDLSTRTIRSYSYELNRAEERVWWYDPTEHPGDPSLAATHPHHKHIHPDPSIGPGLSIKHHRVPAL